MPLTLRQERFLVAYFGKANGNGTEAAAQAGYTGSRETLAVTAFDTLRSPKVQAAMGTILGPEGVQAELTRVATIDPSVLAALPSKVRSLELLGRIHGLLSDKLTIGLDRDSVLAAIEGRIRELTQPSQEPEPIEVTATVAQDD